MRCVSVFQPSGNAPPGGQSVARSMPRQMPQQSMVGGMPRVAAGANMAAFNAASQAGMAGLNPGNIPMQRGAGGQSHPHQVVLPFMLVLLKKVCDCGSTQIWCGWQTVEKEGGSRDGDAEPWVSSAEEAVLTLTREGHLATDWCVALSIVMYIKCLKRVACVSWRTPPRPLL